MTTETTPAPEAPAAPPAAPLTREQQFEKALSEELTKEGLAAAPPPGSDTKPAPIEAKPEPVAPPEPPALAKLARQAAEFRKEKEAVAPYMEALKVLPTEKIMGLTQALKARDPVAILATLGFTAGDVKEHVLRMPPEAAKAPSVPSEKEVPSEIMQRLEKAESMLQRVAEREEKERNEQLVSGVGKIIKGNDKFQYLGAMESYSEVIGIIGQFHKEHGRLPADSFEESVTMAAEIVEGNLKAQAEKWRKVLTPAQAAAIVKQVEPTERAATGTEHRTLTNTNTTAPAAVRPTPKTREERIAALLADPQFDVR
jgi:hypothetical protein